nr:LuxR family transcriptional regulator [Microbacterium ulmi]
MGRAVERETLRALVASARNGASGAVLIDGDPGVGKTTLMDAVLDRLTAVRILRIVGYEVEAALPYAALQRLCRPLAPYVNELAPIQREALRVATGLAEGPAPERALVGLGILSLLARAGDDEPLVCVVDDAQHLDGESLDVLGFVARRLSAESVAMLFAAREDEAVARSLAGVPRLELAGLDAESAAAVLRDAVDGEIDPGVVADFVSFTDGNPLALRELGAQWSIEELTAVSIAHSPVPLGRRLEAHYSARVATLSHDARRWVLVAAAEATGDAAVVRAAAARLGLPPTASGEVEALHLVEIQGTVRFRHPLVRSAVYNGATDADRRAAHAALCIETSARGRREFAAWHAAAACGGPDAGVAAELAAVADLAGARGGFASRARLLARAAALSPEPTLRAERFVSAAEAAIAAGAGVLSRQLLARADRAALDPVGRGRLLVVEAMCAVYLADPLTVRDGLAALLCAADAFHGLAPDREQKALLIALNSSMTVEDRAIGADLEQLAIRMRAASDVESPCAVVLRATSAFALEEYEVAVPLLRTAVAMLDAMDDDDLLEVSALAVSPCIALWDCDAASRLLTRTVRAGTERGALREVDSALWVLSAVELSRVNPRRAGEHLAQAEELRRALGYADEQTVNAAYLAWQGGPRAVVEQIVHAMSESGYGGVVRMAVGALGIREIAEGEYHSAFDRLAGLIRRPYLQASHHHLAELVEAAVRSDNRAAARAAAATIDRYAAASGTTWVTGLAERCAALLADDADAERHFLASIETLDTHSHRGDCARSRLVYGEWLRRVRRRADARVQLVAARDVFTEVGADAFAERARRELTAAGAKPDESAAVVGPLTSQETAVARLAAQGATNADIGSALFISSNTVDYHLRKVFRKLGVTSRRQLAEHFPRS